MSHFISHFRAFTLCLMVSLPATGCGLFKMPDKMDHTNEQIEATNRKMDVTNAAIHNQTLVVALAEMMKAENTRYLAPVPTSMLPAGESFAKEATAEELSKLTYVFLKEIQEVRPESNFADWEEAPEATKKARIAEMDHQKVVKLNVLLIVAGLAPQSTVEQVVQTQILGGGRYRQAGIAFLMLRGDFIGNTILKSGLFASSMRNLGEIEEGVRQVGHLDYLRKLPFASEIQLQLKGFSDPDSNFKMSLDSVKTAEMWRKLESALTDDLDQNRLRSEDQPRLGQAHAVIREALDRP